MTEDFVLLNGDTLFEAPVLERLVHDASAPVTLAIDRKAAYDDDDMKGQPERRAATAGGRQDPDSGRDRWRVDRPDGLPHPRPRTPFGPPSIEPFVTKPPCSAGICP